MVLIPDVDVSQVDFKDSDGDAIHFQVAASGTALEYSINGKPRPQFQVLKWHPALGMPGILMPDIKKGFPLPIEGIVETLAGLKSLCKKANAECSIPSDVVIPDGVLGLPNDMADLLLSQHAPPKGEE